MNAKNEIAVLGAGCFWCTEAVYQQLKGVVSVEPGYAGGHTEHPTYQHVSSGETGHAEVARIEFNPEVITYQNLLDVFFSAHDPTTLNRQGNDVGSQYRSVIFTTTPDQKDIAEQSIKNRVPNYPGPILTEVRQLDVFYPAEDYHKDYYNAHKDEPYCQLVITPKIKKVQEHHAELIG
ncbi:MAG: peptide-methionine (S)-S-oxide reductase MsrA [Candidatus Uhrbacteria bacterium]|nr:peptide-methionine (S)-S-oxide reductase MsrA [Candidatus Uhrbacteria bacterium]